MLRLNYYNGNSNFGDALAKSLIERLSGQMVVHGASYESQLMAVGSVFGDGSRFIAEEGKTEADASDQPLIVWGSGFLEPKIPDGKLIIRRRCDVRAVRGIHTREALVKCGLLKKGAAIALGDPGLFYPDLVPGCREMEKLYDVALVPHVLDRDKADEIKKAFEGVGLKVVLVDVLQSNPLNCIREIAASKKVIASSMHALIVADSLGIPNRRLKFSEFFRENDKRQYDQSDFKFKDYYSAFGMEPPEPTTEDEVLKDPVAVVAAISKSDVVPKEKIDICKRKLLKSFPSSLKNDRKVPPAVESPKLSVIIPIFNAELYLHECLASILNQDAFTDMEVICIDDGSTDSSPDILSYWVERDCRIKVLRQCNQGPGVARNTGLAVAKGDYITFVDADDRLTSGANLMAAFDYAEGNRLDVEVLASNNGPDADGNWTDNRHLRRELVPWKKVFAPKDVGINLFLFVVQEPWAKLYRREFITANKLQFPPLKRSEDFPFVMSALLLSQRIGVLDVPLCDHRVGVITSLESTKDETPCIFIDAEKWFCKSINLPQREDWAKLAFRVSQVTRYAYNLQAIRKDSSFRKIVENLCNESDDLFQRVDDCQNPSYLNSLDFIRKVKRTTDDDALVGLIVDAWVRKGIALKTRQYALRKGEDRAKIDELRDSIARLHEEHNRLADERKSDKSKIAELRGAIARMREDRDRMTALRESDKSKIAELRGAIAGMREDRDRMTALRESDKSKIAELRGAISGMREGRVRLMTERQADKAKIAELRNTLVGMREERDRMIAGRKADRSAVTEQRAELASLKKLLADAFAFIVDAVKRVLLERR